jgi:RNA polymerase sigma-70 factor (ECF subfamily)
MATGRRRTIEHLVLHLTPKERACLLLKDVFYYSLEEVAVLVDSTVGGVKAVLSRGRSKLAMLPPPRTSTALPNDPELSKLLTRYVDLFSDYAGGGHWKQKARSWPRNDAACWRSCAAEHPVSRGAALG